MPSMYEIYDSHAFEYDELVSREDHAGYLKKFIEKEVPAGGTVLEIGTGTGRVTGMYIERVARAVCCDRAGHMLERARHNLAKHAGKIEFKTLDTRDLGGLDMKADLIIEGWALGHTAIDECRDLKGFLETLFDALRRIVVPGGKMIFIETMGTAVDRPAPPAEELAGLYRELENGYGMKKSVIPTDYRFESVEEARRVMSFFFGESIREKICDRVVREYTGAWTLTA